LWGTVLLEEEGVPCGGGKKNFTGRKNTHNQRKKLPIRTKHKKGARLWGVKSAREGKKTPNGRKKRE